MKKIILFVVSLFIADLAWVQQVPSDTEKSVGKHGRIEQVVERGHRVIRFVDKTGKKLKELPVDSKDTVVRVRKDKGFRPGDFKVKISTQLAQDIEDMRKGSKRDIALIRKESKEARVVRDNQYLVLEESVSNFLEYADADDSERAESAAESSLLTHVYDREGNKILELSGDEGCQPVVSNTGHFFVVTVGEYAGAKILNRNREVLAEFDATVGPVFFSMNDKYILAVKYNPSSKTGLSTLTVFDTKENKFSEVTIPWGVFAADEIPEIDETGRKLIMRHAWDPATKAAKVDTIQF